MTAEHGGLTPVEKLAEAMQYVWDEHCSDTGCVPDAFSIRGPRTTRVEAVFCRGTFAEKVLDAFHEMGGTDA